MNDFIQPYKRYAQFEGRSDRKELWLYVIFYLVVASILSIVDMTFFPFVLGEHGQTIQPLTSIFSIASLIPSIAVGMRRLHDTDRSGWWLLVGLIPLVGWIPLVIWYAQKGQPHANAHGEPPEGSRGV